MSLSSSRPTTPEPMYEPLSMEVRFAKVQLQDALKRNCGLKISAELIKLANTKPTPLKNRNININSDKKT